MTIAYFQEQWIPLEQASIPAWDYGFTMGVTLTEQLRTFAGKLPLLEYSLDRLFEGIERVGIAPPVDRQQLRELVIELVARNPIVPGSDMSIGIGLTAGDHLARKPSGLRQSEPPIRSRLLLTALPLSFEWADQYTEGVSLVTVPTREIPDPCLPRQLKCRSRMHYFLAQRQAEAQSPGSYALLQQLDGSIAEGTTASLLAASNGKIYAPPRDEVLPSLSVRLLEEQLCPQLQIEFERQSMSLDFILNAEELFWLTTPSCILPVARVNQHAIVKRKNQPNFADDDQLELSQPSIYHRLQRAWSAHVGLDLYQQARAHRV